MFGFGEASRLNEKIIYTQKNRIQNLEKEVKDLKDKFGNLETEQEKKREHYEKSKERLVDQIIGLSDKFAEINQKMLEIAHENSRLKLMLETKSVKNVKKKKKK